MLYAIKNAYRYACSEPGFYVALFIVVWLAAWIANGLKLTAFNLTELRDLAALVATKYVAYSTVNSKFGQSIKEANSCEIGNPVGKV